MLYRTAKPIARQLIAILDRLSGSRSEHLVLLIRIDPQKVPVAIAEHGKLLRVDLWLRSRLLRWNLTKVAVVLTPFRPLLLVSRHSANRFRTSAAKLHVADPVDPTSPPDDLKQRVFQRNLTTGRLNEALQPIFQWNLKAFQAFFTKNRALFTTCDFFVKMKSRLLSLASSISICFEKFVEPRDRRC